VSRVFESLAEFDAYIAGDQDRPQDELIADLSNAHLADPALLDVPDDPFSAEYRDAVLAVHAAVSGYSRYEAESMEQWPVDIDESVRRPAPYRNDGSWLADYLESFAHVIRRLDVAPGMRVVDLGCGDAEIVLHLARLGCDVTAVDLHPDQVEIVRQKAEGLRVGVDAVCATFDDALSLGSFDRVLFYQAFHHSLEHQSLVAGFDQLLEPGGRVVFGAEPVIDPAGPWAPVVPYPWGPRLDGLSLRQMRMFGWMELGFQAPYFHDLLKRHGWTYDNFTSDTNGLVSSIVSERIAEQSAAPAVEVSASASTPATEVPPRARGVVRLLRRRDR